MNGRGICTLMECVLTKGENYQKKHMLIILCFKNILLIIAFFLIHAPETAYLSSRLVHSHSNLIDFMTYVASPQKTKTTMQQFN